MTTFIWTFYSNDEDGYFCASSDTLENARQMLIPVIEKAYNEMIKEEIEHVYSLLGTTRNGKIFTKEICDSHINWWKNYAIRRKSRIFDLPDIVIEENSAIIVNTAAL